MSDERTEGGGVTRLSFIKASAGAAAGAAAIGVPAAAALADQHGQGRQEPFARNAAGAGGRVRA